VDVTPTYPYSHGLGHPGVLWMGDELGLNSWMVSFMENPMENRKKHWMIWVLSHFFFS
jgi:hypothetical protein